MKAILDGQEYPIKLAECAQAKEVASLCPLELSMERSGGHEYYARLPKQIKARDAQATTVVYRGGVYYFDAWNALALVFEDADIRPYSVYVVGEMNPMLTSVLKSTKEQIQMKFAVMPWSIPTIPGEKH